MCVLEKRKDFNIHLAALAAVPGGSAIRVEGTAPSKRNEPQAMKQPETETMDDFGIDPVEAGERVNRLQCSISVTGHAVLPCFAWGRPSNPRTSGPQGPDQLCMCHDTTRHDTLRHDVQGFDLRGKASHIIISQCLSGPAVHQTSLFFPDACV